MRIILGMTLMALVLAPAVSQSQPHIIDTIAGNGTPGSSGDGGPAVNAVLSTPRDVAVDAQGNVYVSSGPRVRKINAVTGIITTVAGNGDFFYNGDGIPATSAAIGGASGIALDAAGNLYIAQATLNRVRRVDALTGIITTVAGTGVEGFSGDGGPATSATFFGPFDVAVGPNGDLCISDTNNRRIRRVNGATGVITTIGGNGGYGPSGDGVPATAVTITHPWEVAFDAAGNCHFAEFAAHRIRRIDQQSGLLWTAAGTGAFGYNGDGIAATAAQLNTPRGIFFDAANNLLVADTNNGRIRRVDRATGLISTIAGSGEGFSGDGGPALNAQLVETYGFTQDAHGNLYLTDSFTHRIRRVANAVPSVDAGPDASYAVGQPIALDGSASFDADGDSLTYRWREAGVVVGEGPDVTLERPAGTYVFELTVTDSWTGRSSDSVTVTVLAPTPTPTPTLTPTSTPTPTPTPTPTATSTPTPTRTPTPTPTSGPTYVEARVHAVRSNVHHSHPEKTIDDRLSTYWTGHGDGVWLKYDLGQTRTVGFVKIAFLKGDERRYRFDIQVSRDAHTWSTVRAGVQSSGTTREEEAYDFPDVAARYVRYVGHGSTAGRKNSVTEVSLMVRR